RGGASLARGLPRCLAASCRAPRPCWPSLRQSLGRYFCMLIGEGWLHHRRKELLGAAVESQLLEHLIVVRFGVKRPATTGGIRRHLHARRENLPEHPLRAVGVAAQVLAPRLEQRPNLTAEVLETDPLALGTRQLSFDLVQCELALRDGGRDLVRHARSTGQGVD